MFWDLYQQMQIHDVQDTAWQTRDEASMLRRELRDLRRSIDSLALTCAALWELQRERGSITDDELVAKMQEIDLRDGQLDGKMTKPATVCPSCERANNASRKNCMYCGTSLPTSPM
ncbi:MAG: hypothetical protein CMJ64_12360 [Planctomycetaceae bacterium]|nr:hypothetical protein [Planctomycetaceae bacterium]